MRAYQQDEALVKTWITKEFPAIKKLAKREKAGILAGVRSDAHIGTTWAPIGELVWNTLKQNIGRKKSTNRLLNQGRVINKPTDL